MTTRTELSPQVENRRQALESLCGCYNGYWTRCALRQHILRRSRLGDGSTSGFRVSIALLGNVHGRPRLVLALLLPPRGTW